MCLVYIIGVRGAGSGRAFDGGLVSFGEVGVSDGLNAIYGMSIAGRRMRVGWG